MPGSPTSGSLLRSFRDRSGLSVSRAVRCASEMGYEISETTIYRIEGFSEAEKKRIPKVETVIALLKTYRVDEPVQLARGLIDGFESELKGWEAFTFILNIKPDTKQRMGKVLRSKTVDLLERYALFTYMSEGQKEMFLGELDGVVESALRQIAADSRKLIPELILEQGAKQ